jgi:hypothetical protein
MSNKISRAEELFIKMDIIQAEQMPDVNTWGE